MNIRIGADGAAGMFVVRNNTWLDPVPDKNYKYPEGRWYGSNGWGRVSSRKGVQQPKQTAITGLILNLSGAGHLHFKTILLPGPIGV